jgi:hypothetical protein
MRPISAVCAVILVLSPGCIEFECGENRAVPLADDYCVVNNQHGRWRLEDGDYYDQCAGTTAGQFPVAFKWTCNTTSPGVKGYPQILFGLNPWSRIVTTEKLPSPMSSLVALSADHTATLRAGGEYNLCFDLWFIDPDYLTTEDKRGAICLEIMAWLVDYAPNTGEKLGVLETPGNTWAVYFSQKEGEPPLLMFLAARPYWNGTTDLLPFCEYASKHALLPIDALLACVEFGSEVTSGSGVLRVDWYRVNAMRRGER